MSIHKVQVQRLMHKKPTWHSVMYTINNCLPVLHESTHKNTLLQGSRFIDKALQRAQQCTYRKTQIYRKSLIPELIQKLDITVRYLCH